MFPPWLPQAPTGAILSKLPPLRTCLFPRFQLQAPTAAIPSKFPPLRPWPKPREPSTLLKDRRFGTISLGDGGDLATGLSGSPSVVLVWSNSLRQLCGVDIYREAARVFVWLWRRSPSYLRGVCPVLHYLTREWSEDLYHAYFLHC